MAVVHITEHFTLQELYKSSTAKRLGIDNNPPKHLINNLLRTALMGERIRARLNIEAKHRINGEVSIDTDSVFRCEELEKVLTKADFKHWCWKRGLNPELDSSWRTYFERKAHPDGRAMDFTASKFGSPYDVVKCIAQDKMLMIDIDQIIMEGDWVHVAWAFEAPRQEVLTATFDEKGSPTYTEGLA